MKYAARAVAKTDHNCELVGFALQNRSRIVGEMEDIVKYYAPWIAPWYDIQYLLEQPWLMGFRKHSIQHDAWEYLDLADDRPKR